MNTTLEDLEASLLEKSVITQPHCKVLILFEDSFAGSQAMRLYEFLINHGGTNYSLETFRWDLKAGEAMECLIETISMADIIIVAGRSDSEFPVEIQGALQVGLSARRSECGSMVAYLGCDDLDYKPVALSLGLEELARRWGLDFFSGIFPVPAETGDLSVESLRDRTNSMTTTLQRILQRDAASPHWGINE